MARIRIAGTSGASENTIVFSPAGGHSHNGRNSSLIDSTAYSMYDFSPTFVGTEVNPDRAVRQENNRIALEDTIKRVVNNSVLAPAGIRLEQGSLNGSLIIANTITANQLAANTITAAEIFANTITADQIASNTITADELVSNIVLVNNIIRSNVFTSGSAGWRISNDGTAEFSNVVVRGNIFSNVGTIGGWTLDSNSLFAGTKTASGSFTPSTGQMTIGSDGHISANKFRVNTDGSVNATTGRIGPVNITNDSMNSQGSSPYLNSNYNYYNFNNFGDISIFSNPGTDVGGNHVNQFHATYLVGEYIQINKSSTSAFSDILYEARIGDSTGTYAEVVVLNANASTYAYMYSTGNIGLSGTLNGYSFTSSRHNGANQMVHTDGNGYLQVGYINSSSGNEGNNSSPSRVWGTNGSDDYLRSYLTSALSVSHAATAGDANNLNGYPSSVTGQADQIQRTDANGILTSKFFGTSSSNLYWNASNYADPTAIMRVRAFAQTAYQDLLGGPGVYSTVVGTGAYRVVTVNSNNTLGTVSSTRRHKENIKNYLNNNNAILSINPVLFDYKPEYVEEGADGDRFNHFGLIAEDLDDAGLTHLVYYDKEGLVEGIAYEKIGVEILSVVIDQQTKIDEMESRLQALEGV